MRINFVLSGTIDDFTNSHIIPMFVVSKYYRYSNGSWPKLSHSIILFYFISSHQNFNQ